MFSLWVIGRIYSLALLFYQAPPMEDAAEIQYILSHKDLAMEEMRQFGIPASIKLAQALVESDAGRSVLALRANNHFGIKCKSWWTGGQYFYADDDYDKDGRLTASCFRIYDNVQQSFSDHSLFLRSSGRYDTLFSYDLCDYKSWATGLQRSGYATSSKYARNLIQVIEYYRLFEFDRESSVLCDH
jgi:flagellum-specific peptidoglycan hydrolase FlgJ